MKDRLDLTVEEDPDIQIDDKLLSKSIYKFQIDKNNLNILLGIGGSGPTKRVPSKIFLDVIDKISNINANFSCYRKNCRNKLFLKKFWTLNLKIFVFL